jgi:hypothetical protein
MAQALLGGREGSELPPTWIREAMPPAPATVSGTPSQSNNSSKKLFLRFLWELWL